LGASVNPVLAVNAIEERYSMLRHAQVRENKRVKEEEKGEPMKQKMQL